MGIIRWGMVALSALTAVGSWASYVRGATHDHGSETRSARYQCPMHPQVISDSPGECPICHMTLVPMAEAAPQTKATSDAGPLPQGTVPVELTLDRVQSIGVRTALAEARTVTAPLRLTAVVSAPEQSVSEVHVRTSGFVERMSVRETGVKVGAGQELFAFYSPEAYQAETELVTARGFGDAGAASAEASRRRLELLGVPTATIDAVAKTGAPVRAFPVFAPAGGYVTKKSVVLGSYVTPEATLYELVDLSTVWVVADLAQRDALAAVKGAEGTFTPTGGAPQQARVDLVYPQLDPEARTTRVRFQIANQGMTLRPGQSGIVELQRASQSAVVVPRDAVVDTGKVAYVFLDSGNGRYTPRIVLLGSEQGESVEIRQGVAAGERVVSGATFLIDAESRLRASVSTASGH